MLSVLLPAAVQAQDIGCSSSDLPPAPTRILNRSVHEFCDLTADFLINNCQEIFVNVNVHYFVDDACEGKTGARRVSDRLEQPDVYQRADDYIRTTNEYLAEISENNQWNQLAQFNAIPTDTQCVLLRLVLDEVHIHCETDNLTFRNGSDDFSYMSDPIYDSGINIFIANVAGGSVNGFATFGGTWTVVEDFSAQLNSHEIGHCLELRHTSDKTSSGISYDNCVDTPEFFWEYDQDGDGNFESCGSQCFDDDNFDSSGNDLCVADGNIVINTHPCCEDNLQDNNVMSYALAAIDLQRAAFTPCQMEIMIDDLLDTKCDLIEDINPACPPPSAFIGELPVVDYATDCNYTFYFQASTNESSHRITYQAQQPNGNFAIVSQSAWDTGTATQVRVAIGTNLNDKFAERVLLSNTTYQIVLETADNCGNVDQHVVEFTTGDCDLREDDGGGLIVITDEDMDVYPNPTVGGVRLSYTTQKPANIEIYISSISNDGNYAPPVLQTQESGQKGAGYYTADFSSQKLANGLNYIIIRAGDEVHLRAIVKNN